MSTLTSRHSTSGELQNHSYSTDLVQLKSQRVAWEILAIVSRVTQTNNLGSDSTLVCRRFKGKVNHQNFKLTCADQINPFVRTMHARVIPVNGGCLIQYRMEMSGVARIVFGSWFAFITTLCFAKIGAALMHGIAPGGYDDFVMLFLIVMFSLYIAQLLMAEARRQEALIEQFLLEIACAGKKHAMV